MLLGGSGLQLGSEGLRWWERREPGRSTSETRLMAQTSWHNTSTIKDDVQGQEAGSPHRDQTGAGESR